MLKVKTYFFLFLIIMANLGVAQVNNLDSLLNIDAFDSQSDLQKELNAGSSVAGGKALAIREIPGIVSVIHADELRKMGARDITDVLRYVPGFEILQDIQFVTGVGFRGSWANEGKILFMIDGHQMNELAYQTVPLINSFDVDGIEKIEIIRGPGSAIYGGSAEYGVINIITKQASSLNGVTLNGTGGFHSNAIGRTNGSIAFAQRGKKFTWDAGFFMGKGIVSDGKYQLIDNSYPKPVSLSDKTWADPKQFNAGFSFAGLSARLLHWAYETSDPDYYIQYKSTSFSLKYDWRLSKNVTITPSLDLIRQKPWNWGLREDVNDFLNIRATRQRGNIVMSYYPNRNLHFNVGAMAYVDKGTSLQDETYFGGERSIEMSNMALFAQGLLKVRWANITGGFRYEHNNLTGDAFVPRLAITKRIQNFHFKALYSQSFRTPALENVNLALSGNINPEKTKSAELEFGYQFTPEMLFSVNLFSQITKDVIIFEYVDDDNQGYNNYEKSGSKGIEVLYQLKEKNLGFVASYSMAVTGDNSVTIYEVPQTTKTFAGFPKGKFSFNGFVNLGKKFTFNTSLLASGKRYAYTALDNSGASVANALPAYVMINPYFSAVDLVPGLNLGIGVFDLLNEKPGIPQAFDGGFAPIPGRSREYVIKLSYNINFK